jgi:hypothetical protein
MARYPAFQYFMGLSHICQLCTIPRGLHSGFCPFFTTPRVYLVFLFVSFCYVTSSPDTFASQGLLQPSLFMGLPGIFASLHCSKGFLPAFTVHGFTRVFFPAFTVPRVYLELLPAITAPRIYLVLFQPALFPGFTGHFSFIIP